VKRLLIVALLLGSATQARQIRAQAEDEETEVLAGDARRAIAKQDFPRAAELLDHALRVNPRRIDLYILRASVHGVLGEHDKAITVLRRAQQLAPDNDNVATALGIELVQVGKTDEGTAMLEKIVARQPRRFDAQAVLGHQYATRGEWARAATAFAAYFDARPSAIAGEDKLRIEWANAELRAGDAVKARGLYEQVLASNKHNDAARLGVAWSAAAIDCKGAMSALDAIADLEKQYPEVSLVRGRCALILGRIDDAQGAAERYRKARPDAGDGWALSGDVALEQKNAGAAEAAFTKALAADGKNHVYSFKLARAERRLGKLDAAAHLLEVGAPAGYEDDWTIEYGEVLYARGDGKALAAHIGPWSNAHPDHATGQFLTGVALIATGETADAIPHLDRARALGEPRAAKPLIQSLDALATAAASSDLGKARALFEQAAQVGDDPATFRGLGAVLLAQGDASGAVKTLEKATAKTNDAVAWHLLARAYQNGKAPDQARNAFAKAIKAYGSDPRAVAAGSDLAALELATGRGEQAVDALIAAFAGADAATKTSLAKSLVIAARAAATDAMRTGKFGVAVRVLRDAQKYAGDSTEVQCDLALAATGNGNRDLALDQLHKLESAKATCPYPAPADELAISILIAWNEGASLRKAEGALARLERIRTKARGAAEPLARMAARDIALRGAQEAYANGNLRLATKFLLTAKGYDRNNPELIHDLAVIDLANGNVDGAIAQLSQIKDEVPEAYVNLGVAYDRKHDAQAALDAWKKAMALGVRYAPLKDWIDAKTRFWGDGGGTP